eukprot:2079499-Amphidinium_carterae.1
MTTSEWCLLWSQCGLTRLVLQGVITRGRSRNRKLNRVYSAAGAFILFADVYPLMSSWTAYTRCSHIVVRESIAGIEEVCPWVLAASKTM